MRRISLIPVIILIIFSFSLSILSTHAAVLSGWGTATIDGVLYTSEWETASTLPFSVSAGAYTGTIHLMNDATNLYIGVILNGDNEISSTDGFLVYFDNDNGGETTREIGDDVLRYKNSIFEDHHWTGGTSSGDNFDGGTIDGQAAGFRVVSANHFELSHPLNSADNAHDFSLSSCQLVGFTFDVIVDNTAYTLFGDNPTNPSTWANDYQVADTTPCCPPVTTETTTVTTTTTTITTESTTETVYAAIDMLSGEVYAVVGGTSGDVRQSKPAGTIYAAWIDSTAGGVLLGMSEDGHFCWDTDSGFIDQTTGEPTGIPSGETLVLSGGPIVNGPVKYYELNRATENTPAYYTKVSGLMSFLRSSDDQFLASLTPTETHDMFIIEIFQDSQNRTVIIVYGFAGRGTLAGALYFVENADFFDGKTGYWVYYWVDNFTDGTLTHPDPPGTDFYTLITSGP
ncbi:hypothetical protein ACFLQ6_03140 [Thermoproteota archaeon]